MRGTYFSNTPPYQQRHPPFRLLAWMRSKKSSVLLIEHLFLELQGNGPLGRILFEYLTVIDIPSLDTALCNHTLRPLYLNHICGKCISNPISNKLHCVLPLLKWSKRRQLGVNALSIGERCLHLHETNICEYMAHTSSNTLACIQVLGTTTPHKCGDILLNLIGMLPRLNTIRFHRCEWVDTAFLMELLTRNSKQIKHICISSCNSNISAVLIIACHLEFPDTTILFEAEEVSE